MLSKPDVVYILGAVLLLICSVLLPAADESRKEIEQASPYIRNLSAAAMRGGDNILKLANSTMHCENKSLWRLVIAVVMVENYFRGVFRRKGEILYAQWMLNINNKLPNISLGLAQLQPGAARLAVAELGMEQQGDEQLLQLVSQEQDNLRLAYGYFMYLKKSLNIDVINEQSIAQLSKKYNGSANTIQTQLYAFMVENIYQHIQVQTAKKKNQCMQLSFISLELAA